MYLSEPNLFDHVKQQFRFKLNAHAQAFTTLIFLQIGAMFLAFTSNKHVFYDSNADVTVFNLSNNGNVGLSMIWAFVLGIMLTTTVRRNEAFSFVTTRLSNHLANLLFMLTASLIAGIIATLSGPVLKLLGILRYSEMIIYTPTIIEAPIDFFMRMVTAIGYILLLFLVGYTISSFIQLNKLFIGLFVFIWIAFSSVTSSWNGNQVALSIIKFFSNEHFSPYFSLKIIGTILLLFAISTMVTNRLEVRN